MNTAIKNATLSFTLDEVDQIIANSTNTDINLAKEMIESLLSRKGKRIRAQLVLQVANLFCSPCPKAYKLAAIIELIHVATLLHDDVIDESTLRRGVASTCSRFGNAQAVLAGDFLYSNAFILISQLKHDQVLSHLAQTTSKIVEGEIDQLANENTMISKEKYYDIITAKTGLLFAASAKCAALLYTEDADRYEKAGLELGIGYQILDDLLDYDLKNNTWGKNIGDDIRQGKCTLPLILFAQQNPGSNLTQLSNKPTKDINEIIQHIADSAILTQCREQAIAHIENAQNLFQSTKNHQAMMAFCERIKTRQR